MKTLTSPITTEKDAEQAGWGEVYDIYLKSAPGGLSAPISHWKCEEADGADRVDAIGGRNLAASGVLRVAGKVGTYAAQTFSPNSMYSGETVFNGGLSSFAIAGWFKTSAGGFADGKPLATKWDGTNNAYKAEFDGTRLKWTVRSAGGSDVTVTSAVVLTLDVYHLFVVWHDYVNGRIGISVDNETPIYAALAGGTASGNGTELYFGFNASTFVYSTMHYDSLSFFTSVPNQLLLDELWNDGAGTDYPFTTTSAVLRLCTVPGGVSFFRPKVDPEPSATQGNAQDYSHWPLKRDILRASAEDQNDRLTFAASNVTAEFAQMLADIDWADTPVLIRKISLAIAAPTADDCVVLFNGLIDSARITNEQLQFVCSNFLGSLTTIAPRENMHNNCRWRWADDLCTAIRFLTENYKAKTVGSSSTTTLIKSAGLTEDAGANGTYGTDLVNALADGSITTSSELAAYAGQAVTANSTNDTIALASHGLHTDDPLQFGGTTVPAPLVAATTYYLKYSNSNVFQVAATPGGAAIDLTTNGTAVTLTTVNDYKGYQVKSSKAGHWKLADYGDLGTLTQAYWTIPGAQAGIANVALKPYINFDFGSAKTPRIWRISTVPETLDLSGLPRTILIFSSSSSTFASDVTHEAYAELPPRGGVLFDILVPKALTKRYWRICIRNRWGQNRVQTMLNKVYAYEGGRNWWAHGTVTFDAGTATAALRGKSYIVRESYSGECVVEKMAAAPASGDTFVIERGCGRGFNHCAERKNTENFGGFLDLPLQAIIRA